MKAAATLNVLFAQTSERALISRRKSSRTDRRAMGSTRTTLFRRTCRLRGWPEQAVDGGRFADICSHMHATPRAGRICARPNRGH